MKKLIKLFMAAASCFKCGKDIPGSVSGAAQLCNDCSKR